MRMINDQGGVNGRKINFISYDDAYSPPKTVEQARKLVESDEVLLIFQPLGTPTNSDPKYMNIKKVPHLFVSSRSHQMERPEEFPVSSVLEAQLSHRSMILPSTFWRQQARRQDRDPLSERRYRGDFMNGLKEGLGDKAKAP